LKKQIDILKEEIEKIQNDKIKLNDILNNEKNSNNENNTNLQNLIKKLENENETLNKKSNDNFRLNQRLIREKENLIEKINELQNDLKNLNLKHKKFETNLNSPIKNENNENKMLQNILKNENQQLKSENEKLKQILTLLFKFINELNDLFNHNNINLNECKENLNILNDDLDKLRKDIYDLLNNNNNNNDNFERNRIHNRKNIKYNNITKRIINEHPFDENAPQMRFPPINENDYSSPQFDNNIENNINKPSSHRDTPTFSPNINDNNINIPNVISPRNQRHKSPDHNYNPKVNLPVEDYEGKLFGPNNELNINVDFKNKKRKISKDYSVENDWKSGKCWACHLGRNVSLKGNSPFFCTKHHFSTKK
jgi:hypothetical protein